MNTIEKIMKVLAKILMYICELLVVAITVMIFAQVILRTLRVSVPWTEEMSRYAYVIITYIGSYVALVDGKHIMITAVLDMTKGVGTKITLLIGDIFILAISVICVYSGYVSTLASKGVAANSVPWFQYNYLYYTLIVSFALMAIYTIFHMITLIQKIVRKEDITE